MKSLLEFAARACVIGLTIVIAAPRAHGGFFQIDDTDGGVPIVTHSGSGSLTGISSGENFVTFGVTSTDITIKITPFYVNIFEPDGTTLSDRFIWTPFYGTNFMEIQFASTPQTLPIPFNAFQLPSVIEDGTFQTVLTFTGFHQQADDIYQVRSVSAVPVPAVPVPAVPEPSSLLIACPGLILGIGYLLSRRKRRFTTR